MHAHEDYLTILSWSIYSELQYESRCTLLLDLESIECYALFRFSMLHGNWLFFCGKIEGRLFRLHILSSLSQVSYTVKERHYPHEY